MTWPLYFEAPSKTADQEVGAGRTFWVLYISRLAPRPCGMPYILPFTEFQAPFFNPLKTSL